jgi:hypothetical protein
MTVRMIIGATLGALVLTVAGCGGDGQSDQEREQAAQAAVQRREDREHEREEARRKAVERERDRKNAAACQRMLTDFVDTVGELDSRLDIGLNYDEYTDQVADAKVVYDRIDFHGAGTGSLDCIQQVGLPAERALNQYAKAAGTWGDCFDDFDCDTDSIQGDLQSRWTRASAQVDRASRALNQMRREANG